MEFDPDLMIPDQSLSINDGAIVVLGWQSCNDGKSYSNAILQALSAEYGFSLIRHFRIIHRISRISYYMERTSSG